MRRERKKKKEKTVHSWPQSSLKFKNTCIVCTLACCLSFICILDIEILPSFFFLFFPQFLPLFIIPLSIVEKDADTQTAENTGTGRVSRTERKSKSRHKPTDSAGESLWQFLYFLSSLSFVFADLILSPFLFLSPLLLAPSHF